MTELCIEVLITYRLSRLICLEDGPVKIFAKLRKFAPDDSNCVPCVSMWISLGTALLTHSRDDFAYFWLGIAGGTVLVHFVVRYFELYGSLVEKTHEQSD